MKKLRLLFSLGACLLGAWIPMSAHHSFQAEYDDEKPIILTGRVTKVSPDNPHGWIYLDVKNDKGRIIMAMSFNSGYWGFVGMGRRAAVPGEVFRSGNSHRRELRHLRDDALSCYSFLTQILRNRTLLPWF